MKEKLKQELPFSLGNFVWRVTVPMAFLLAIGFLMDRFLNSNHLFGFMAVFCSLTITVWGIRVSIREHKQVQLEPEE